MRQHMPDVHLVYLILRYCKRQRRLKEEHGATKQWAVGIGALSASHENPVIVALEMARHVLPAFVHARNLRTALAFGARVCSDSDQTVVCDAAELKFVDPSGLCVLAATCNKLAASGKKLMLLNLPDAIAGYLARMDLFKACGIEYDERFARHDRSGDLVELCALSKRTDIE